MPAADVAAEPADEEEEDPAADPSQTRIRSLGGPAPSISRDQEHMVPSEERVMALWAF